jgi:hypothetical protein
MVPACHVPVVCRRIDGVTEQDILDRGIELIAVSFVDGAGLTRAKSITAARAEASARYGLGASTSLSSFTGEDILATATGYEATGDVRLLPDLDRLAGGIDGWGWAPGDLVDQEGQPWDVCTRSFLKRQVARVAESGYELRMTYELEWYAETEDGRPVHATPAYSLNATSQAGSYMREVAVRLAATASRSSRSTRSTRRGRWRCRWGRRIRWGRPTTASPLVMPSAPPGPPPASGPHSRHWRCKAGLATAATCTSACGGTVATCLGSIQSTSSGSRATAGPSWPECCANAGR